MAHHINKGWSVTFAGLGVNLALGILYTWSVFKLSIKDSILAGDGRFTWDPASLNDPYAVCCIVFAVTMIFAGRLQDKFSPRLTTLIGGVLAGAGLLVVSQSNALSAWIWGFGILVGMGIGCAYASATPPAIKWFPPSKTGMIAGIVVAGFGLASVYIAPLASFLIAQFGLSRAMMIFGFAFFCVISFLSFFLVNPPKDYVPVDMPGKKTGRLPSTGKTVEQTPLQMMKTLTFYRLWFMYFVGAGAGLFIIGGVAVLAKKSMGDAAWAVVAFLAVGNAAGRVVAGVLSDRIGRSMTLSIMLAFQALLLLSLLVIDQGNALLIVTAATLIGFNYGTNLALFPSLTKDHFGLTNFGTNYGLVFTAWGVGGLVFPKVSQALAARTGSLDTAYLITAGLLIFSSVMAFQGRTRSKTDTVVKAPEVRLPLIERLSENYGKGAA
jgi:nitrate/nitrite transporter NarK